MRCKQNECVIVSDEKGGEKIASGDWNEKREKSLMKSREKKNNKKKVHYDKGEQKKQVKALLKFTLT